MQRICSQQSRADAYSWRVMSRALGCALLPSVYPQAFRPSSILLDSSYPLVFLMRLEQGPLPGGAARCSSGMASVLELEGKGPELFVRSWHVCDDQLHFSTEICLYYLPWRNACIQQHSSSYLWNWPQAHTQKMGGNKINLEMPSKIKNHFLPSNMRAGNPNEISRLCYPAFIPISYSFFLFKNRSIRGKSLNGKRKLVSLRVLLSKSWEVWVLLKTL